ncbi:putative beta-barrel assembly-enhancing protease [Marinobacterium nitratireducens]|uniref:Putative beta-barrel assembly-enhancing protease n=1 Tax=Marinobacterium nitratireducens TaxID=518897 RepID=A0A917ZDU2_9GAMM|nr:M48 family metalloprotease [Marinobacterium nitratireducens]GGO80662.1 putative beta-barrel assembly-enhancing protease [Marinobacterium nitratireducens]
MSAILPLRPLLLSLALALPSAAAATQNLPSLGDSTSGIISLQQEARLGDTWARVLRGQAKLLEDPVVYDYLQDLLWSLAANSQLSRADLELITLDNPTLNAFAVPGGVIGVHGGLLLAAEAEDELASVLAHEIAHLSQRHFAMQLAEERRNRPFMLAALLGSFLVAATTDGQAGAAAITSTIGASEMARLSFSRQNEQEADRIGMSTLAATDFDPGAMPRMFERLQRSKRFYGDRPPEFLLTHPVTQSRIADSLNRAAQLPKGSRQHSSRAFGIARTRLQVRYSDHPEDLIIAFESAIKNHQDPTARYGLALAAAAAGQYDRALKNLDALDRDWRDNIYIRLSRAEILQQAGRSDEALALAGTLERLYPGTYAVRRTYAKLAQSAGQNGRAIDLYEKLRQDYPHDTGILFNLAECYGLEHRILKVHETRIEYFLRTAQPDRAMQQIDFALRENSLSESDRLRVEAYREDARQLRKNLEMDF